MTRTRAAVLLGALVLATSAAAQTAGYPSRTVRFIVPFPAGGSSDAMTRIVTEKLSARWGRPVVVENRPGAGGNIGAEAFAKSEPDGHTYLSSPLGPVAANQVLFKKLSYDSSKFVPVSVLGTISTLLVVRTNIEASNVQGLIALAKAQPGRLTYASQGNGSTSHLTAAMFEQMAGISLVHVPYQGAAPALLAVVGNQVDLYFDNIASATAQLRAGKVRVLAVGGVPEPALPGVPTMSEALPGFYSSSWVLIVGPGGLPDAIAQQASLAIGEALKLPDVQKKYSDFGAVTVGGTPAEAAKFLGEERARWTKVIQDANVRVDN